MVGGGKDPRLLWRSKIGGSQGLVWSYAEPPARPGLKAALSCLFLLVVRYPQLSHLSDGSGTDGKVVGAQEILGPAWAARGLQSGLWEFQDRVREVELGWTPPLIDQGELEGRQQGWPKG